MKNSASESEFGKDLGLLHEVVITGRSVGADKYFYSSLAHNKKLFKEVVDFVKNQVDLNFLKRSSFIIEMDYLLSRSQLFEKMKKVKKPDKKYSFDSDYLKNDGACALMEIKFLRLYPSKGSVVYGLEHLGYRPTNIEEIIVLLATHGEAVKDLLSDECNLLIAFGTVGGDDMTGLNNYATVSYSEGEFQFGGLEVGALHEEIDHCWVPVVKISPQA